MNRVLGLVFLVACLLPLASCAQGASAPTEEASVLSERVKERCPGLRDYSAASVVGFLDTACEMYEINGANGHGFDVITTMITRRMTQDLGISTLEGEEFLGFTYERCPDIMEPFFYN